MRSFESSYENVQPAAFTQREFLKSMDFDSIESLVHALCPTIFCLFYMLSTCIYRRQHWASNKSDANFFIVMVVCCMAYQLSSANNAFQRLFGYYFKAKKTPKGVVDMLSDLNLCMSYRSTLDTCNTLSVSIRQAAIEAVHSRPFIGVHDNFRAQKKVASQRSNRQTVTDNGTAITVIVLPDSARPAWESPEEVRALRSHIEQQRALGAPLRVKVEDLLDPVRQTRVLAHKLGHIFAILRAIPCLKGLAILSDPCLQYPPSWHQLKSGPEYITEMYMLGTRPIDESSYSGNLLVIQEAMRQLGFDFGDPLVKLALERIIPWIGDELTIARLRMLIWLRREDKNAYDRLDPLLLVFGWFHAQMCLAFSTFENHRGSVAGFGLARTVHTLQRTGFTMNMRKVRADYHTVKECLMHTCEASIRDCWLEATQTTTLDELKTWMNDPTRTVEEVLDLGKRIQRTRVSRQAPPLYQAHLRRSGEQPDEVFMATLLRNRDLELYWDLGHAVKHGDVGHMEDLIPDLLSYFTGSGNANYARQMYEILQTLYYESTDAMRHGIRENCWLVNMSGRKNGFYPVDKRQELNNGGLRSHGPAPTSAGTWEDIANASPLIPLMMDVVKHVEDSVTGIRRSRIHKDPDWEDDLLVLMHDHSLTKVMVPVPGRLDAATSTPCKDVFKLGSIKLQDTDTLAKYAAQREPFFRSRVTTNDFSCYLPPPPPAPERPEPPQDPLN
ncbi:hypothetical protein FRC12_011370 [Ceratobasidium sp. 428]|nr:hypothetical protein FRC12_011370 [Ceratobasidium sp. 428]